MKRGVYMTVYEVCPAEISLNQVYGKLFSFGEVYICLQVYPSILCGPKFSFDETILGDRTRTILLVEGH
jgi:hypothetical protein